MTSAPRISPEAWLAESFGDYLRLWAKQQGALPAAADVAARAGQLLSKATCSGQVCLRLGEVMDSFMADDDRTMTVDGFRRVLLESKVVGSAETPGAMPLILDGDDRLYLHRYFDYERRLARCLHAMRARASSTPGPESLDPGVAAMLERLFEQSTRPPGPPDAESSAPRNGQPPGRPVDWQQIAVVTALLGRLTIISGGPGTGKTTAIVNLLACVLAENPACRIALAAPTGKAAARITDTIRQRAAHLPEDIASTLPQESYTVHRLLGVLPDGGFRHHAENPLPIDVLVVDEASMLDLALATQLFEAVPPAARVILVGDKDQLAAVESGAVFAELSADPTMSDARIRVLARICGIRAEAIEVPRPSRAIELTDSVVWLRRNFRFGRDSAIGRLAEDINSGDAQTALARLRHTPDRSLVWLDDAGTDLSRESAQTLLQGYARYLEAVRTWPHDPDLVARELGHFRILCAVRDGYRGAQAINERVGAAFRARLDHRLDLGRRTDWYPGRPVMVLRNDYRLQLFNGDIGIVLPDSSDRLMVHFPGSGSGFRAIPPARLPEHETAFAMTVHKAQGSEFDEVLVVLPAQPNRVLTRELLYTAVTRSRERVIVMGGAEVIEAAVRTVTDRLSGLEARLRDTPNA